ncbi:unnamed protein product, partial [Ectocarpus fasciculatus]
MSEKLDFSFPFTQPYPEQRALMECIYETVSAGQVGVLESPTGTGKSLSIICAALTWLYDEEKRRAEEVQQSPAAAEDDWLQSFLQSTPGGESAGDREAARVAYASVLSRLSAARATGKARSATSSTAFSRRDSHSVHSAAQGPAVGLAEEGAEFVLDEYDSDGDRASGQEEGEEGLDAHGFPKIIYCSRTHSQISQFVNEIKKTAFRDCRCVVLGSRKQLCVLDEVSSLPLDSLMSEACLDKQKAKATTTSTSVEGADSKRVRTGIAAARTRCPLHRAAAERALADRALARVCDVEELAALGKASQTCPYYGSRRAVGAAQLVCLPYNMLVQKSLRDSLGVGLRGNVVIIDEAHNIVEAVSGAHSAEVSLQDINTSLSGVNAYVERYGRVLGARNLVYINLLRSTLAGWRKVLEDRFGERSDYQKVGDEVLRSTDFLFRAKLDNINFMKLKRHISTTMLARKVGGYWAWARRAEVSLHADRRGDGATDCTGALRRTVELLTCLAAPENDGRIVLCTPSPARSGRSCSECSSEPKVDHSAIKFILLNAASQFRPVVDQARAVLLLGGTMQPFQHLISMLFPGVPAGKLRLASFGHVVAANRVKCIAAAAGVGRRPMLFKHDTKFNSAMLDDLGETLVAVCRRVPGGCPCFFTSYKYMEFVLRHWGLGKDRTDSLFARLAATKRVFVEARSSSETTWAQYSAAATGEGGALLFCVIGGKMSEGINFSDALARCVVVIGMPYPDSRDAVLKEKLRFAEQAATGSGSVVYESMCMKAVNQCIGRAIRHAADFSSILLLDARYRSPRVASQLPAWIHRAMSSH